MTDGIIQKVFDKYLPYFETDTLYLQLRDELIAEIKKLNKHSTRHKGQIFTAVSLKAIIGSDRE